MIPALLAAIGLGLVVCDLFGDVLPDWIVCNVDR